MSKSNLRSTLNSAKELYLDTIKKTMPKELLNLADAIFEVSEEFAIKKGITLPPKSISELDGCPIPTLVTSHLASAFNQQQGQALAACFSLVLGEDIPVPEAKPNNTMTKFIFGLALVQTFNSGTSYKTGEVAVSLGTSRTGLIRKDGIAGNNFSSYLKDFRIASKNEILEWLVEITLCRQDLISTLCKKLNV